MKKLLLLKLLVLVTCLSSALSVAAYSFSASYNGKTIYYNITSSANRTVEVTYKESDLYSVNATSYSGAVTIPSSVTYNGYTYTVTAIGDYAFCNAEGLSSISIPSTVTRIGEMAFSKGTGYDSNKLTSVTIPNSVTTIGNSAFRYCQALKTVNFGTGVTSIGAYAFIGCQLTSVTIPNNVTTIEEGTFYGNSLTTVTIPNNVTTIGGWAFYNCPITTLYLGFRVQSIGSYAFYAKKDDPYNRAYLENVYCYCLFAPSIQQNTFYTPDRVYAATLHILSYIYGDSQFGYQSQSSEWNNFYTITTISGSTAYDAQIGGLYYQMVPWPESPGYYAKVVNNGNYNCYTSSSYTVPATVSWRSESFIVRYIENSAFRNCTNVSTLDLRNATNLKYIRDYACYGAKVSTVYLSPALTSIGSYAFYNSSITKLYTNNSTPPTIQSTTFSTRYSNCYVYVPYPRDIATYKAATYWSNFVNYFGAQPCDFVVNGIYYKITGTNTVEVTNKWGGYGMLNNESDYSYSGNVTVPNTVSWNGTTYNVTAIGEYAFFEARNANLNSTGESPSLRYQGDLRSVTIGSNVTTIKDYAFWGCTSLTTVRSNRTTPPTIQSTTFDSNHYSNAKLYVPKSAINSYKAANYWKNFYLIVPNDGTELDYALNVEGGNIHFTTDIYPWTVAGDGTRVFAQSGNAGVASTTSAMTASVSLSKASILTFDFKAWGEGTSYDKCIFAIDGVEQFSYGARQNDWETFTAAVPAGSHILTWNYQKDSSVNPEGDYFAVDNVKLTEITTQTGDVNGDGQVTIADVTELIDMLLGNGTAPAAADVNGDGQVTIADVTELIDRLLGS